MREFTTSLGTVRVGSPAEIFARMVDAFETAAASYDDLFTVGLTGGSTPKAFYDWAVRERAVSDTVLRHALWSVSDERHVPLDDPESNFGNAARLFLDPLEVPPHRRLPWPVQVDPHSAALVFERRLRERYGNDRAFDLCFLGMGEDGHTASIFPGSPLLQIQSSNHFAPVEVPGKGWRLSITPAGLRTCGHIVVMVTGAAKARRLREVLEGPEDIYPVQLLRHSARRVEWLADAAAAALLRG